MGSLCADVVVTYNRKELLAENIAALIAQSYRDHDILIIDNASTDGTFDTVSSFGDTRVKYFNTGANLGGAGGFAFGIRKAIEAGYKYAWIMDDDAIPEKNALQSLIEKAAAIDNDFSFIASNILWKDGSAAVMNSPAVESKDLSGYANSAFRPVKTCSFVGCLINLEKAVETALPVSEFFIYGDDVEYTGRLRSVAPAFQDLDSIIIHKTPSNTGIDIARDSEARIERYYYQARNEMYTARKNKRVFPQLFTIMKRTAKILLVSDNNKGKRIGVLLKGTKDGLSFDPELQYAHPSSLPDNSSAEAIT